MREVVDRMRALEHGVHDAMTARREEFEGGVAYFHDDLPAVWDLNFVRLDRPSRAPALDADRLQAGLGHRKVLVEDPALVARFGRGLRERGYGEQELIVLARDPGGTPDADVHAVPAAEIEDLIRQVIAEQLTPPDPAVIEQLVRKAFLCEKAGGQWIAAYDDGRAVAHAILYSHEGLMQIEDVATLRGSRGRGIARRMLEHALGPAADGHDTVFIQAEANDWPLAFYERLGFERVEQRASYLLIVASST